MMKRLTPYCIQFVSHGVEFTKVELLEIARFLPALIAAALPRTFTDPIHPPYPTPNSRRPPTPKSSWVAPGVLYLGIRTSDIPSDTCFVSLSCAGVDSSQYS